MRWATRQHVLTARAIRRSRWHRWFAWHPIVVREKEFEHRVWFAHLERKWSFGRYGEQKGHWRYRYPVVRAEHYAEQYDISRDGALDD
jgi:hypothetical protein